MQDTLHDDDLVVGLSRRKKDPQQAAAEKEAKAIERAQKAQEKAEAKAAAKAAKEADKLERKRQRCSAFRKRMSMGLSGRLHQHGCQ